MAVQTSKLWSEPWFMKLKPLSKLIYLYCLTRPGVNTLGLFVSTPQEIIGQLTITMEQFNTYLIALVKDNHLVIKEDEGLYWFWITDYVKGFPKKGARFETGVKQFNKLPYKIQHFIKSYLPPMMIVNATEPPTPEQVSEYALQMGYLIDGKEFVDYYQNLDWKDTRGKKVHNWKTKVRQVWCKKDRKIEPVKGAPEGFEFFHAKHEDRIIFPTKWTGGKPYGKSIIEDQLLQKEFEDL